MRSRKLYVFDTNTLISAALFAGSPPRSALRLALTQGDLLASPATLKELRNVINRSKFARYLTLEQRFEYYHALLLRIRVVEPRLALDACRDPADNKFLELAIQGGAEAIVTGDGDLLALHPFQGVSIVNANQFLEQP